MLPVANDEKNRVFPSFEEFTAKFDILCQDSHSEEHGRLTFRVAKKQEEGYPYRGLFQFDYLECKIHMRLICSKQGIKYVFVDFGGVRRYFDLVGQWLAVEGKNEVLPLNPEHFHATMLDVFNANDSYALRGLVNQITSSIVMVNDWIVRGIVHGTDDLSKMDECLDLIDQKFREMNQEDYDALPAPREFDSEPEPHELDGDDAPDYSSNWPQTDNCDGVRLEYNDDDNDGPRNSKRRHH